MFFDFSMLSGVGEIDLSVFFIIGFLIEDVIGFGFGLWGCNFGWFVGWMLGILFRVGILVIVFFL